MKTDQNAGKSITNVTVIRLIIIIIITYATKAQRSVKSRIESKYPIKWPNAK